MTCWAGSPDLVILIDTFEQRIQRPKGRTVADTYYVPGPTAHITLVEQSGVLKRLSEGASGLGDLAYGGHG